MLFFLSFFSYAIGIACGIIPDIHLGIGLSLVFPLILMLLGGWQRWYIIILITSISLGGWYMGDRDYTRRQFAWESLREETHGFSGSYTVKGTVQKAMYTSDLTTTYRLNIDSIANISTSNTGSLSSQEIGIFVEVPKNLHIGINDTIEYTGKIMKVINFPLKGFAGYAWYNGIYGKSTIPIFKRVNIGTTGPMDHIQSWAQGVIFRGFPENIAGIILGMTIGNIDLLSSETKTVFKAAGITHILVVSGSNIAFVIVILTGILKYLPVGRWIRASIVILFVLAYGSLVGWDMPVVRAVAMGLITYMVMEGGKRASSLSVLFLVGWGILLYSPLALIYDAGFGLSFAGTLGILLLNPIFSNRIKNRYTPQFIVDIVSVTLSASMGSLVAIIYHFGFIPVLTIFSNILISGVLGWILFSSVLYLLLSLFGGWVLYIWGWTIYLPTAYIVWVSQFFGNGYIYTIEEKWAEPIAIFCIGILITIIFLIEKRNLLQPK